MKRALSKDSAWSQESQRTSVPVPTPPNPSMFCSSRCPVPSAGVKAVKTLFHRFPRVRIGSGRPRTSIR